jgi:hypothetical protein
MIKRAERLLAEGHRKAALEVANQAVRRFPGDAEALFLRATILLELGQYAARSCRFIWFLPSLSYLVSLGRPLRASLLAQAKIFSFCQTAGCSTSVRSGPAPDTRVLPGERVSLLQSHCI